MTVEGNRWASTRLAIAKVHICKEIQARVSHVEGCSLFGGRVAGVTRSTVVFRLLATEDHATQAGNSMMTVESKRWASSKKKGNLAKALG